VFFFDDVKNSDNWEKCANMSELHKLKKKMSKLEKKYESATPVMRFRLAKSAESTQRKIDLLTRG